MRIYDIDGSKNPNFKHGGKGTRLYGIWKDIKKRCVNKNHISYKYYGAKGISRCKEWDSFDVFREWSFANGYSDQLTIDRIDGDKNYCPLNCRWVTYVVQNNNTSQNVFINVFNERMTLSDAQRKYGVRALDISRRIKRGWTPEEAVTIKPKLGNNGKLRISC